VSTYTKDRLKSVNHVRGLQRDWLAQTRDRVSAGEHFAVCNGDECEEIFIAMNIPVMVVNYWNYIIVSQGKEQQYYDVLRKRGYVGDQFFALGLASAIEPGDAPWGGMPKPTLIVGTTRFEAELRICELWAREMGCPLYPLDFSFPSPLHKARPKDWLSLTRDRWEELLDPKRLDFRVRQEEMLIRYLEQRTGRTFSVVDMLRAMELINEQMDWWIKAQNLIGATRPCPVDMRDQMSIYQAMWHRGTERGVQLIKNYYEEIGERAAKGIAAYRNEKFRIYYGSQVPPWHAEIEDKYGAVAVAGYYTGIPELYARNVHNNDPLRALAGRHMLLFNVGPERIIKEARIHQCDAVIGVEPSTNGHPSLDEIECERAGFPYLAVPRDAGDPEIVAKVSRFIEERLK
jgi:hypothetical protein